MSPYFSRSQRHVLKLQSSCRNHWVKTVNVQALVQKRLSWEFSDRKKGMPRLLSKCKLQQFHFLYMKSKSFVTVRFLKLFLNQRENPIITFLSNMIVKIQHDYKPLQTNYIHLKCSMYSIFREVSPVC